MRFDGPTLPETIRNYINKDGLTRLEQSDLSLDEWLKEELKQCNAVSRTGERCKGRAINGTTKCKSHGGKSTGPKTKEGKARARANLKQYRNK